MPSAIVLKRRAIDKRYYYRHRRRISVRKSRKWYSLTLEQRQKLAERSRRWFQRLTLKEKLEHSRACVAYTRKKRRSLRRLAIKKLGSRCANPRCMWINKDGSRGCTDRRCLQVDHVFGGGKKEYKKRATIRFYQNVINDLRGRYQCLCANCNWIKRALRKESPFI